jgi:hypothetical protein
MICSAKNAQNPPAYSSADGRDDAKRESRGDSRNGGEHTNGENRGTFGSCLKFAAIADKALFQCMAQMVYLQGAGEEIFLADRGPQFGTHYAVGLLNWR